MCANEYKKWVDCFESQQPFSPDKTEMSSSRRRRLKAHDCLALHHLRLSASPLRPCRSRLWRRSRTVSPATDPRGRSSNPGLPSSGRARSSRSISEQEAAGGKRIDLQRAESVIYEHWRRVKVEDIDTIGRTTLEILVSQGSPWKKGLSQAPCPRAILTPLSQSRSSTAAAQHCSWAILQTSGRKKCSRKPQPRKESALFAL